MPGLEKKYTESMGKIHLPALGSPLIISLSPLAGMEMDKCRFGLLLKESVSPSCVAMKRWFTRLHSLRMGIPSRLLRLMQL